MKPFTPSKTSQFCIITPTSYLEQYASQSSMHLVLAHLVDTDPIYAEFYANRTEYKIMDNGAFELGESYNPSKLIDLAHACGADTIVLPDYPAQQGYTTVNAAQERGQAVKDAGFSTMFVPQSMISDMDDWILAYKWASNSELVDVIGMSILGIPNAMPHIPKSYARVVMTQLLIDRGIFNFDKPHHYLGLNAGPALEIPPLIAMGAMSSCDSSGPVWQGILGHEYTTNSDSYAPTKKIQFPVQFDYDYTNDSATHRRIQHNIDLTQELIIYDAF
jgi:hypothetical protein